MKISYNWLKQYLPSNLELPDASQTSILLTNGGLEVESVEKFESIQGGLEGLVVGEVKTKEKHPDADRLNITTVDVGGENLLHIVCGAANVEIGQKVVVATIGAKLYPTKGEFLEIKKSRIRGAASEGMICAEDEIGIGTSHEGIMVLPPETKVGTLAKDYFKVESDYIFEIGLTPNRADAASHIGVARDLIAILNAQKSAVNYKIEFPSITNFKVDALAKKIDVIVEDASACPRYSGITISDIVVKESPEWLKNKLKSIGLKPINNVVDITNYILHELGQPLHAFDADKIKGNKIIVKKLASKTKFKTLDGNERELTSEDVMICNQEEGMCLAGIFGGLQSGVTSTTTNIFIESAYFDAVHIRKSSKHHGLKTDASFRYERGTDPNITVYALKRAALLIKEVAGGFISSDVVDIYPNPIKNFIIDFSYKKCNALIGQEIPENTIKIILESLEIEIVSENNGALLLSVPPYRVDVQREVDIVEEILRIYGYNNIQLPKFLRSSISYAQIPNAEKIQNTIADVLTANGFNEIFTNSLTKGEYYEAGESDSVTILNPLSSDLNTMRKTILYSGLESIAYNQNRKNTDLKFYEFGKTYHLSKKSNEAKQIDYQETKHLALFLSGKKYTENWNTTKDTLSFYSIKGYVNQLLFKLGIDANTNETINTADNSFFEEAIHIELNKTDLVSFGKVKRNILKKLDIKQEVYYADFNWDLVIESQKRPSIIYKEVAKFPEVKRDLALLLDKSIQYQHLEQLAYQTEKKLLKTVNLFDVYEGDKIESGKKSYALSFVLQDEYATLTDKQIDAVMEKLIKTYTEKVGAIIR